MTKAILEIILYLFINIIKVYHGDWGLGIGDWAPYPKPTTPKPKPQTPNPKK